MNTPFFHDYSSLLNKNSENLKKKMAEWWCEKGLLKVDLCKPSYPEPLFVYIQPKQKLVLKN